MEDKKRTEISDLGKFGLVEKLTEKFKSNDKSTIMGVGDDAAVIGTDGDEYILLSSDLLLEGINFDLVYFPLKHLGYKAVVVGISDILAMNGTPHQITLSIAVSAKLSVEHLELFYEGVRSACEEYGVDLVGGDTTASVTGFVISVTTLGRVAKESISYRSGAKPNDLICITGDLGAAYMGLHLLEREKRAFAGHSEPDPQFKGYEYILRSQLQPAARKDIIDSLKAANIVPSAMIDLTNGLSSDMLQISRLSNCGARIYLNRIPISSQTHSMAEELGADPVVAALNGGDDHELLFTVPLSLQDKIEKMGGVEIIGHITGPNTGTFLVTPDGGEIKLTAPAIG